MIKKILKKNEGFFQNADRQRIIFWGGIYLVVFIISIFVSPWSPDDVVFYNKILFFGVYDMLEVTYSVDGSRAFGFFFAACTLFGYFRLLKDYLQKRFAKRDEIVNVIKDNSSVTVIRRFIPKKKTLDDVVADFSFDNAVSYLICLLLYYLYEPAVEKFQDIASDHIFIMSLVAIVLVLIIILPALAEYITYSLYMYLAMKIVELISIIARTIKIEILAFLIAWIVLIAGTVIINMITNYISDILQNIVKEKLPVIFEGLLKVAKVSAVLVGVLLVLALLVII